MIFEDLAKTTKDMQDLQKKISIQQNKDAQDAIDTRYRVILAQVCQFVDCIEFLYKELIEKNQSTLESAIDVLKKLDESTATGLASGDETKKAEDLFKSLQVDLKKDWQKQYADLTGSTLSTLDAVSGIEPDKVAVCSTKIQAAEMWNNALDQFKNLQVGLADAEKLITELGLDDDCRAGDGG